MLTRIIGQKRLILERRGQKNLFKSKDYSQLAYPAVLFYKPRYTGRSPTHKAEKYPWHFFKIVANERQIWFKGKVILSLKRKFT